MISRNTLKTKHVISFILSFCFDISNGFTLTHHFLHLIVSKILQLLCLHYLVRHLYEIVPKCTSWNVIECF